MGGCVGKSSFTVNKKHKGRDYSGGPTLFCRHHLERILTSAQVGEFLLYKDLDTAHILLSVRMPSCIRHHRISELEGLFYMQGQPYPYLDSILLYHRRHKLNGVKLLRQVYINARDVRSFAQRLAETNGNFHMFENRNTYTTPAAASESIVGSTRQPVVLTQHDIDHSVIRDGHLPVTTSEIRKNSRASSDIPLLTSSNGSASRRRLS